MTIKVYVDGSAKPNPGKCGVGILFGEDMWYGLYQAKGTNNVAELNAIHHALMMCEEVEDNCEIITDSQYCMNAITKWAYAWVKRNWMTAETRYVGRKKTPKKGSKKASAVKNREIIEPAHNIYDKIKKRVKIKWERGHSGVMGNEVADVLACIAVDLEETDLIKIRMDNEDLLEEISKRLLDNYDEK